MTGLDLRHDDSKDLSEFGLSEVFTLTKEVVFSKGVSLLVP